MKRAAALFFACVISAAAIAADTAAVRKAIDGDTLRLAGGERVRLIGVDAPEIEHDNRRAERFGRESAAFVKREIEGRAVRLEYETERFDKYGRTLAYVYREPDGLFLNAEIIRQGYGFAYTRFPFARLDEFRAYEREAREKGSGLWGDKL